MRKFEKGDLVIRIKCDWHNIKLGETYEVAEFNEKVTAPQLILKGVSGRYSPANFKLHPASGSPLMKALK